MRLKLLSAVLFLAAGGVGMSVASARAVSAAEAEKGCWYQPPDPPACDICGWSCGAGQQCCTIET